MKLTTTQLYPRRRAVLGSKFGFHEPRFDGKFEYGFVSVGSDRVCELWAIRSSSLGRNSRSWVAHTVFLCAKSDTSESS